jgi:hypothetical protein
MLSSSAPPEIDERFFRHFTAEEEGFKILPRKAAWLRPARSIKLCGEPLSYRSLKFAFTSEEVAVTSD